MLDGLSDEALSMTEDELSMQAAVTQEEYEQYLETFQVEEQDRISWGRLMQCGWVRILERQDRLDVVNLEAYLSPIPFPQR